jgi:hypothetical protein
MSSQHVFGSSHARPDPPKKKPENVRTTPGDPLRDEIRKTPKRVEDPDERESRRTDDSKIDELEEAPRKRAQDRKSEL